MSMISGIGQSAVSLLAQNRISVSEQPQSTSRRCWPFGSLPGGFWKKRKKNSVWLAQPTSLDSTDAPGQLFPDDGGETLGYMLNRENPEIAGSSPPSSS